MPDNIDRPTNPFNRPVWRTIAALTVLALLVVAVILA